MAQKLIEELAQSDVANKFTQDEIKESIQALVAMCKSPILHLLISSVEEKYGEMQKATGKVPLPTGTITAANGLIRDLKDVLSNSPNTSSFKSTFEGIDDPFIIQFIVVNQRKKLDLCLPDDSADILERFDMMEKSACTYWPVLKKENPGLMRRIAKFLELPDLVLQTAGSVSGLRHLFFGPYSNVMKVWSGFMAMKDDSTRNIKQYDRYQLMGTNPAKNKPLAAETPATSTETPATSTETPATSTETPATNTETPATASTD